MSEATPTALPFPQKTKRLVFFPSNISSQNNFGLLRLALALLVIFCHSFGIAKAGVSDFLNQFTKGQIDSGAVAVDCFFTISGFLIASSWMQTSNFRAYLQKRMLRIFPGLAGVVLFCIFIVGPLAGVHLGTYFRDPNTYRFAQILLLRDAFCVKGLPGVFPHNPFPNFVDGSLWTIRYEFLCYLLIPFLALFGLLKRRWLLLALFLGLMETLRHVYGGFYIPALDRGQAPWSSSLGSLPRLVMFFLAGVTFYSWRDRIPRSLVLLFVSIAALVLSRGHAGADHYFRRLYLIQPFAETYIIFYTAYAKSVLPQLSRLTQKHDLSYGVYLYGFPVQQLLAHYAQTSHIPLLMTTAGMFCTTVPLTLGLALLSWNYVEKPFLKMKPARKAETVHEQPSPTVSAPKVLAVAVASLPNIG